MSKATDWHDGAAADYRDQWLYDIAYKAKQGHCGFCDAPRPDDVRWPLYTFEMRSKEDGSEMVYHEFLACEWCRGVIERRMAEMGAR